MAVAEIATMPITNADDAIEEAWQVKVETGGSVLEAVIAIWPRCRFSSEALHTLAMDGLAYRAHREKVYRQRTHESSPGVAWGAPHGERRWHDYLNSLTHPFQGADGAKPLYEFDRADLASFAIYYRTRAEGYLRRVTWAADTLVILDEHEMDKVSDLPSAALKQVAESASEAFGRQE